MIANYYVHINIKLYDWFTYTDVSFSCASDLDNVNWYLVAFSLTLDLINDLT